MVSDLFDSIEVKTSNREFVTHTGNYRGNRITAMSTGIGTDNIDIVLNELDALVNIDFEQRVLKKDKKVLNLVRTGTVGSPTHTLSALPINYTTFFPKTWSQVLRYLYPDFTDPGEEKSVRIHSMGKW